MINEVANSGQINYNNASSKDQEKAYNYTEIDARVDEKINYEIQSEESIIDKQPLQSLSKATLLEKSSESPDSFVQEKY